MSNLIAVQTFTSSAVFRSSFGTSRIIVEVQGAGGSGGGTAATTSSTGAASSGGTAGAFAKAWLKSGFEGVAVTVGVGGAAPAAGANAGSAGGNSSFGNLVIAPGGPGGQPGPAFPGPVIVGANDVSPTPTGGNIITAVGAQSTQAFVLSIGAVVGGTGGDSYYGGGGFGGGNSVGGGAISPGSGGGGSSSIANVSARSGGTGANGIVIVYEYT